MGTRPRHPNKEIEAAVADAEDLGWRFAPLKGHGWGKLLCPSCDRNGCQIFVYSTPRSTGNHARDIRRAVKKCDCANGSNGNGGKDESI